MSRLLLCALALMMSVDFRGSASEQRKPLACEKSGICSLGKTRPYTGDISRQGELRKALDARSYKKEVIIITSTSDHRMLPLLLVLDNLAQLGMDHVLILSLNHDSCTSISQHAAAYGCAFYNSSLARGLGLDGAALLWHNRYRTLMRAARLGFNALSTDSDMTFFDGAAAVGSATDAFSFREEGLARRLRLLTVVTPLALAVRRRTQRRAATQHTAPPLLLCLSP